MILKFYKIKKEKRYEIQLNKNSIKKTDGLKYTLHLHQCSYCSTKL